MAKSKTHVLEVTVKFDKPCTKSHAKFVFNDCVWGEFYPVQSHSSMEFDKSLPEIFRIGRIK